jgi:parallel beta-helix repeat protein
VATVSRSVSYLGKGFAAFGRSEGVLAALALGVLAAAGPGAVAQPPAPQQAPACGTNLTVSSSMQLQPNCRYTGTTTITGSNLLLDCRGASLDGEYRLVPVLKVGGERGVSNVEIRNCTITGSRGSGVIIGLNTPDSEKPRGADGRPDPALQPHRITFQNVTVSRNGGVGIYVDDSVQDVSILGSSIEGNAGVGIYLDHSSLRTRIADSRVLRNGFGQASGLPVHWNTIREGIAIDSSADNIIENSVIAGNKQGGIFLYRNCGEEPNDARQVMRTQSTTGNIIRNNTIEGGAMAGIAIASRQEMVIRPEACRLRVDAARGVFPDSAPGNRVTGNTISQVPVGIRVSDDSNVVDENTISAARLCLQLGSQQRNRLGRPVRNLEIRQNVCQSGTIDTLADTALIPNNGPMTR